MKHPSFSGMVDPANLEKIVAIITRSAATEKIFLTGAYTRQVRGESIFQEEGVVATDETFYDVVVVTAVTEKRSENELQDMIENRCSALVPVNAILQPASKFRQLMESGHRFIRALIGKATVLYDAGSIPIAANNEALPVIIPVKQQHQQWQEHAFACLEGAAFYQSQQQFPMAVFLLHQAAEYSYMALLYRFTGYRIQTHNLDKLMRYTRCFSLSLQQLFPRNTPEEIHLFNLLQKAYVDARYKTDFLITDKELQVLSRRLQKLHALVQQLCNPCTGKPVSANSSL